MSKSIEILEIREGLSHHTMYRTIEVLEIRSGNLIGIIGFVI